MIRITSKEAKNNFSDLINKVFYGDERILITRYGKDIAAIIPIYDLEMLDNIDEKLASLAYEESLLKGMKTAYEDS